MKMGDKVKIRFAPHETGWAEYLGGNQYKICNIPLDGFLNIDDVVICQKNPETGWLEITNLIESHYTSKSIIKYEKVEQYHALRRKIESLGGKTEGGVAPGENKPGICLVAHMEDMDLCAIMEEVGIQTPQFNDETPI